jgi:hypothetical protein
MCLLIDYKAELSNRIIKRIFVIGGLLDTRNNIALDFRDDLQETDLFFLSYRSAGLRNKIRIKNIAAAR